MHDDKISPSPASPCPPHADQLSMDTWTNFLVLTHPPQGDESEEAEAKPQGWKVLQDGYMLGKAQDWESESDEAGSESEGEGDGTKASDSDD
jgi:hypothetical protein